MHQKHRQHRHTSVNRHGVVVALEDEDDLLQPVYQEPFQNSNMQRGAVALNVNITAAESKNNGSGSVNTKELLHPSSSASDDNNSADNLKLSSGGEPATLQLVRKGRLRTFHTGLVPLRWGHYYTTV